MFGIIFGRKQQKGQAGKKERLAANGGHNASASAKPIKKANSNEPERPLKTIHPTTKEEIIIQRSKKAKRISFIITTGGRLTIRVPYRASGARIQMAILNNLAIIEKLRKRFEKKQGKGETTNINEPIELANGSVIMFTQSNEDKIEITENTHTRPTPNEGEKNIYQEATEGEEAERRRKNCTNGFGASESNANTNSDEKKAHMRAAEWVATQSQQTLWGFYKLPEEESASTAANALKHSLVNQKATSRPCQQMANQPLTPAEEKCQEAKEAEKEGTAKEGTAKEDAANQTTQLTKTIGKVYFTKINSSTMAHNAEECILMLGRQYLTSRCYQLAQSLNIKISSVRVKRVKTIWGSCSSKNSISLSAKLILLQKELIDYVILHELAHTKQKNHKAAFWKELNIMTGGRAKILDKELSRCKYPLKDVLDAASSPHIE